MSYEILIFILSGLFGFIYIRFNYKNMTYYDYCDMYLTDKE